MPAIFIEEASSILTYVFFLRKLRNLERHNLTSNSSKLSIVDQIIFYFKKPKYISVYIAYVDRIKAGYLLLNSSENNTYITEVVSEKFQGIGVGSEMISFSKNKYSNLVAIINQNNIKSINLHIKNGFSLIKIDDKLLHFKFEE